MKTKNTTQRIVALISIILLTGLGTMLSSGSVHAHGGDLTETPPISVDRESNTTEVEPGSETSTSMLPYAVGGSVVIVGAVVGLSVWQRRKNS